MHTFTENGKQFGTAELIGKEVEVVIDRPLGSRHPEQEFFYPINYGFIPNKISPDGENLDAYVLGVFEPLEKFVGIVKAVICRLDDIEDKLVVMPKDKDYSMDQILALTEFRERRYKSYIIKYNQKV